MSDNALDGGDYFSWSMYQWWGAGNGWMPIQIGSNDNKTTTLRVVGDQLSAWSSIISYSNIPFFTYSSALTTDAGWDRDKWKPSNNPGLNVLKVSGSGTGTLNIDSSGYNRSIDRKSTRLNSSHIPLSRMPSSA